MAKKFFYVCAGLLSLALAFHLGVREASSQASQMQAVSINPDNWVVHAVVNGQVVVYDWNGAAPRTFRSLPSASGVVQAVGTAGDSGVVLVYDNGDVYLGYYNQPGWIHATNMVGVPVPTRSSSWGALKLNGR
jgi:hypothetical protein